LCGGNKPYLELLNNSKKSSTVISDVFDAECKSTVDNGRICCDAKIRNSQLKCYITISLSEVSFSDNNINI
ncbi:MAG: hypothetical protein MHPSP_004906, partial [Paramarteilia canceri]